MHHEVKSIFLNLYIEGENLSPTLINFFKIAVVELELFVNSKELRFCDFEIDELDCSLSFSDGPSMQLLNKNFRQIDKVTDVLSFPIHENLRSGSSEDFGFCPSMELGDIIICDDVAKLQAEKFNITYNQEVIHLFIHGLLHLLGFDHEISEEEETIMTRHEDDLVKKIYLKLGFENE